MKTSEIRDEYLRRETLYEKSVEMADKAAKEMEEKFSEISCDDLKMIFDKYGIDLRWIKAINYEKLKSDEEYRNKVKSMHESVIMQMHTMLEEGLNV